MSRAEILKSIARHKPPRRSLPEIPVFDTSNDDLLQQFQQVSEGIGGTVIRISGRKEISKAIHGRFSDARRIATSRTSLSPDALELGNFKDPHQLADVDVAILVGQFGVAENGAIWLPETDLIHRAAPFICQHLVLVLHEKQLVANMHQAYQRIRIDDNGFGVFIAGPSKTADIEQSLIIGAHGARCLTILLSEQEC